MGENQTQDVDHVNGNTNNTKIVQLEVQNVGKVERHEIRQNGRPIGKPRYDWRIRLRCKNKDVN